MAEQVLKETTFSKVLTFVLVGTGIYIIVKNYKKENFWNGFLASILISGTAIKIYNK